MKNDAITKGQPSNLYLKNIDAGNYFLNKRIKIRSSFKDIILRNTNEQICEKIIEVVRYAYILTIHLIFNSK